jgi:MFS family permease
VNDGGRHVQRVYLLLTLLNTFAASFIWGINTLFLLDAGLNNLEAFGANAAFSAGMVLFEVPTGVVADTWGRRASFLLGAATLLVSTLLYLWMWQVQAPFWGWVIASATIGLGFTFFSGAVEAWLVDALGATGFDGPLETVFAKGQTVSGVAMLTGAVSGGYIAQLTNLGVPYILRAGMLGLTFFVAFVLMRDVGFTPVKAANPIGEMKKIVRASIDNGWRNPPMRWIMLAAPFSGGVGIYAFFAMQPYLLELWGDETAFGIAGLAAAIVAGAQIVGGLIAPRVRTLFKRRTHALLLTTCVSVGALAIIGLATSFWMAISLLVVWSIGFSVSTPIRQAYVNGLIPSEHRATVLSFDSLMGSAGGVVVQPALGRSADVWSYSTSYVISAAVQALALPFLIMARKENAHSDPVDA